MNQDFDNQNTRTNRFIFSDDFYDRLDEDKDEDTVSLDKIEWPSIKKEVNDNPSIIEDEKVEPFGTANSTSNSFDNSNNVFNFLNQQPVEEEKEPVASVSPSINTSDSDLNPLNDSMISLNFLSQPTQEEVSEPAIPAIQPTVSNQQPLNTIPVATETVKSEPIKNFVPTNEDYNVESGINTELETELMKARMDAQIAPPIVQSNALLDEPNEKQVYRARRSAPSVSPIWEQEEFKQTLEKPVSNPQYIEGFKFEPLPDVINLDEVLMNDPEAMEEEFDYEKNDDTSVVVKSTLLDELLEKEKQTGRYSILAHYGDDFCSHDYITNPAIGRQEEIKQLILILLTPEKSGILVGKPGIGKTSIVEGLAYQLQRSNVPDALKGYRVVSVKTTSLLGVLTNGETRIQTLIDELKTLDKIILFIDEIHMLMGATKDSSLDFANMFKESLGRGGIKMIGATTDDEYERYVLRDKAFVRRFQRVDVEEPTKEQTIRILMGTLPKIEKNTGAVLKYTKYIQTEIMRFIVEITSEYKRVYGIGSRYPDICLTLLSQAFSQAVFDNRKDVNIFDVKYAIENSKNIYPDVIRKELVNFDRTFRAIIEEEKANGIVPRD